jgi:hypothetical protein
MMLRRRESSEAPVPKLVRAGEASPGGSVPKIAPTLSKKFRHIQAATPSLRPEKSHRRS